MEAVVSYTTQMDAARQGIVTPEMEIVAAKENMGVEKLCPPLPNSRPIVITVLSSIIHYLPVT